MKNMYLLLLCSCLIGNSFAQKAASIAGAFTTDVGDKKSIWLFIDNYCSQTTYKDQQYISTFGGPYSQSGNLLHIMVEYNDINPETIGKTETFAFTHSSNGFEDQRGNVWTKVSANEQSLDGLWRITGRQQENKMSTIAKADRKTIKILVDGYFQWIAINPAMKGFYGTGGGQYAFQDGAYNEHIIFFSRDNERTGSNLSFKGSLQEGQWHHSGLSSKGDPIHEIWSREN